MPTPGERRRQAVALAYQENDRAPRVVAKGYGDLAERIMLEAKRQGIYVHDAHELVALLVWVFELSEEGLTHREMPE